MSEVTQSEYKSTGGMSSVKEQVPEGRAYVTLWFGHSINKEVKLFLLWKSEIKTKDKNFTNCFQVQCEFDPYVNHELGRICIMLSPY